MALPLSRYAASATAARLAELVQTKEDVVRFIDKAVADMAGGNLSAVSAVFSVKSRLKDLDDALVAAEVLGDKMRDHMRTELAEPALDVARELANARKTITDSRARVEAMIPKDGNGNYLIFTDDGQGGQNIKAFTPAETSALRTELVKVKDSFS